MFRAPALRVERIEIWAHKSDGFITITIEGSILSDVEANLFAWRDGFRPEPPETVGLACLFEMETFWRKTHDLSSKRFTGQLIHWNYGERFTDVTETCFRLTRALPGK